MRSKNEQTKGMRLTKEIVIMLMCLLLAFSVSIVSANENPTVELVTDEPVTLSSVDEADLEIPIDQSNVIDQSNTIEINESSESTIESSGGQHQNEVLSASNNEETLRADPIILNGGTFAEIQTAINSIPAGETGIIYLGNQTYTGTGTQININKNVIIYGGTPENPELRSTLDAQEKSRTIYSYGLYDIELNNLNIINSKQVTTAAPHHALLYPDNSPYWVGMGDGTNSPAEFRTWISKLQGAAVLIMNYERELKMNNVTITDTTSGIGSNAGYCYGHALGIHSLNIKLDNVEVSNTTHTRHGCGAIELIGNGYIKNSRIINNTGEETIAPGMQTMTCFVDNPILIDNCTFINNRNTNLNAKQHGGGLCMVTDTICQNSIFINNANDQGGGLTIHNNGTVENCTFINNTATSLYGGGISTGYESSDITVKVINCTFENNEAPYGGGIYIKGNDIYVTNSTFTNNSAVQGGGSYIEGPRTIIENSIFDGNNVTKNLRDNVVVIPSVNILGAAVYINGVNASINASEFYNHHSNGSTVYVKGNNAKVEDSHFENNSAANGAGVYIKGENTEINNSTFESNTATNGAGVYINGKNADVKDSTFENNTATNGAGVYINGEQAKVENSTFENNTATNGAGVYINGKNSDVKDSTFESNDATNGAGVYINGEQAKVENSTFENNTATNGAGVYINGKNAEVNENTFNNNSVSGKGGACYIEGSGATFNSNNFTDNEAIPTTSDLSTGLGGAIYVKGSNTKTNGNSFDHNKARNGSAIYTDGTGFELVNDVFYENQAWSYNIEIEAIPEESIWKTEDVNVTVTHVGGDNIINAIHNTASAQDAITFTNVTYTNIYGLTTNTGLDPVHPIVWTEGMVKDENTLYQDSHEFNQIINMNITNTEDPNAEVFRYTNVITDIYGQASVLLPRLSLKPGVYNVTAEHPEDWNYKHIKISDTFLILRIVDLSINKTSDKNIYFVDDIVIWKITVHNAENATLATDVTMSDLVPSEFLYVNYTATIGTYNPTTGIWIIGNMTNGTTQSITITTRAKQAGNFTNFANVTCADADWNMSNNYANKSVEVIKLPDNNKTANNTNPFYHEFVEYYLNITNTGSIDYTNVLTVEDILPEGVEFIAIVGITNADELSRTINGQNITLTITNIPATKTATITIKVKVNAVGDLTNNFTLTGPNGTNKTVNCTITVKPIVDLSINKTSDNTTYFVDDIVIWTITVHNAENGTNATNVKMNDLVPSEFTYINYTASTGTYNPTTGIWNIGTMQNGTTAEIKITTCAKHEGNFTNYANVTCTEKDWNLNNNFANKTVEVIKLPDNDKGINNTKPYYNDIVEYYLNITNTGSIDYTNVLTVEDILPEGVEFIAIVGITNADELSRTINGQNITLTITNIPAQTTATITIKVRLHAIGNLTNNFTLTGPNGTNKTVNCTVPVSPIVDLSINKTSDKNIYYIDETVIWTITVHNAENGTNATNVNVKDLVPSEFTYINYTASTGTYNPTTGIWNISNMQNGTTAEIKITTSARQEGNFTNYANVTCTEKDWNLSNNFANKTVEVIKLPDNGKTANNTNPYYHEFVEYNLTITNTGSIDYTNVLTVEDILPEGVEFIAIVGITNADELSRTINGQNITLTITNIPATKTATITIKVKVNAIGDLTNNFTLIYPNGTNKTVNCTITVKPIVDLSINKTSDNTTYFVDDIVIWTITVHNAENGTNATNVKMNDLVPSEFTYINYTASTGTYNPTTGIWNIGNMTNGTTAEIKITTCAKHEGNFTNYANVTCTEKDWNLNNNFANKTVEVIKLPDNDKGINNTKPYYNDIVEYYLNITNTGSIDYTNVLTVEDILPEGVEFIAIVGITNADELSRTINGQNITLTITNIPATKTATITIKVRLHAIGNLTNNFTLTGPNGTNKTVNCTVPVEPIVDLSINKTSDNTTYFVDDIVIWTITVHNAENGTNATNVKMNDLVPSEFTYINYTASTGTYDPATGIWNIGTMTNGTTAEIKITTCAKHEGNFTNYANVTCTEKDWNLSNNFANRTVEVLKLPDNDKGINNTKPYYNDIVEYYLNITNTGSIDYTNVLTVEDILPEGVEFIAIVGITNADELSRSINGQNITLTITNIPATKTATITIKVRLHAIGNLTNNFTLTGPNGTNKTVNCTVPVEPIVDLSINKTSDNTTYFVDDIVIWTITVHNAENGTNATNVKMNDLVPSEFTYINYTASTGTYNPTTGIWNIGTMQNGTTAEIKITTCAKHEGNFTNYANVTCTEKDWNLSNNFANRTVEVLKLPDNDKGINNTKPYYNDIVEYYLNITNTGSIDYTNVLTVEDILPEGVEFIAIVGITNADELSRSINGQNITLTITNIPATKTATITIKVRLHVVGNITNNFTLTGPNGTNKTVNCTVPVEPIVDLSINKTSDNTTYFVDDIVIWTITVHNAENGTNATNVKMNDLVPSEFTYINYTASTGTYNPTTGIWNIGTMQNGTTAEIKITTCAKHEGNFTNYANVTCTEKDWNLSNNFANRSVEIFPLPDNDKGINNTKPYYNDIVEYYLNITNTGSIDYTNVLTVEDILPEGVEFIAIVGITNADELSRSINGQNITLTITNIPAQTTATITIKVRLHVVGNITNNFTLTGPNGTNKTVNCTVPVEPIVDLSINKTSDNTTYFVDDIVIWTITVHNAENGTNATNVKMNDLVPSEFTYINYTASTGTYDPATGIWNIGTMANGTTAEIKITTCAKHEGNFTNYANVTCTEKDWNLSNNFANKSVEVLSLPDPGKEANNTKPFYGEFVEYYLYVTNTGTITYTNKITLIDCMQEGLEYVSTVSIEGADLIDETVEGQKITWVLTNISAKSTAKITVKVKVNALGNLTNNFTIVGPNGTNKTVNCTIDSVPFADLAIIKEANVSYAEVGDKVAFTITVINNGPNTAVNTRAYDILPKGLKLLGFTVSKGTFDPETGIWDIGDLAPGEKVYLKLITEALVSGKIINEAYVESDTYDNDTTNNYDNATVTVTEPDIPVPPEPPVPPHSPEIPATGNPILLALLALLAVVSTTLRRKK